MQLKIIKEKQNPLFNRKEIIAVLTSKSSPTKQEIIKELSEKYSVPFNVLRVLNIKGGFGVKEFTITANIYESNEQRDKYEKLTKKEKELETKMQEKPEEPKEVPETKIEEKKEEEKPVVEVKEEPEEDKKEKDKSKEEKQNEKELQA